MILTEDQTAIRDAVRACAQNPVRPASFGLGAAGSCRRELLREMVAPA